MIEPGLWPCRVGRSVLRPYRNVAETATIAASRFRQGFDMPSIATATQLATEKDHYRIGEVSRLTNLKPFVLRYWETEFPMLEPVKSASGHRLYRQQDVEMVLKIKRLLYDEGFTIAGARRHLREHGGAIDSDSVSGGSSAEGPAQLLSRKMLLDLRDSLRAFLTLLERR
jgi:DNA-binding transcriptional MerR regulator